MGEESTAVFEPIRLGKGDRRLMASSKNHAESACMLESVPPHSCLAGVFNSISKTICAENSLVIVIIFALCFANLSSRVIFVTIGALEV